MKKWVIAFLICLCICGFADDDNAEGVRLYGEGKFEEAYSRFKNAEVDLPGNPRLLFNMAAAAYKKGDYDKALDLFIRAEQGTDDDALDLAAKYNRGNCLYRMGEQSLNADEIKQAVENLAKAIAAYRSVLEIAPNHADSKHNLIVVKMMLKVLQDRLKKEEENKKENGPEQKSLPERIKELYLRQLYEKAQAKTVAERELIKSKSAEVVQLHSEVSLFSDKGDWDKALQKSDELTEAVASLFSRIADPGFSYDEDKRKELGETAGLIQNAGIQLKSLKTFLNSAAGEESKKLLEEIGRTVRTVTREISGFAENIVNERGLLPAAQKTLKEDTVKLTGEIDAFLTQGGAQQQITTEQKYLLKDVRSLMGEAIGEQDKAVSGLESEKYSETVGFQEKAAAKLKEALEKFKDQNKDQNKEQNQKNKKGNQKEEKDTQKNQSTQTQEIIEKEKADRKKLQELERMVRGRIKSEEKDW